jgi:MFS family permease
MRSRRLLRAADVRDERPMTDKSMRLAAIAALLLAGILAGTQLGKIAPLVGWYQDEVGFSLMLIGWLTSMIGIFVALAALPAGWAIERAGMRMSFAAASVVMAAGGIALAFLQKPEAILAARTIEGAGYLVLVIAIPALLNSISPPAWRAPVLAIWGGFVPVGFAVANFMSAWILPAGETAFLVSAIGAFALFAAAAIALVFKVADFADHRMAEPENGGAFRATMTTGVVLVSLAFGIYVVLSVGFFAFMPAFLGGGASAIALSAGTIALLVPLGNLLTGWLVRGRDARFAAWLAAIGFAATAAAALPAFAGTSAWSTTLAAIVLAISGGVAASALFASIPLILPKGGSAAIAIGLVCQAGGIGTVFGPPIAGQIIESYGWPGFGWFLAVSSAVGIVSLVPLLAGRAERRLAAR